MKYLIAIGRCTRDYLDIKVEAESDTDAIEKAKNEAVARCTDPEWYQGDCEYYETGIIELP